MRATFVHQIRAITGLMLLCHLGCWSQTDRQLPPLHPVRGIVTLDGVPLPQATVHFLPNEGPSSGGKTQDDGSYEVKYRMKHKGAVTGPTRVLITTSTLDENGNETRERVPAKYRGNDSILEIVVNEGENIQNFDLISK